MSKVYYEVNYLGWGVDSCTNDTLYEAEFDTLDKAYEFAIDTLARAFEDNVIPDDVPLIIKCEVMPFPDELKIEQKTKEIQDKNRRRLEEKKAEKMADYIEKRIRKEREYLELQKDLLQDESFKTREISRLKALLS